MKRFDHFDQRYCFFDDEGLPHLKKHTCGGCGHTCQPDDQTLFTDDDGKPDGIVAMTDCPDCSNTIISALGSPEFMDWFASEIPSMTSDDPIVLDAYFAPVPLASAVSRGTH